MIDFNYLLYIDPGTGSMLFTILIGIVGALMYAIQIAILKIKTVFGGGRKQYNNKEIPFVIFSDSKRYWNVFEPICKEFEKRSIDLVYYTFSEDDPALTSGFKHLKAEYIGNGGKAFSKLNFLNATVVLSTTPGLDVYQWKRSPGVKFYVHILHAFGEVMGYRAFGLDYYDAVLISGEHQIDTIRKLEKMRNLPQKELPDGGIPYMDEMKRKVLLNVNTDQSNNITVLLAPSWGPSSILNKYGEHIIDKLLETGYKIIIRPHPQSFISEQDMINRIMKKYPDSDVLEWNRDNDNFDVLNKSNILISDFSGVIFDFSLIFDKPIIYADTNFDTSPYDAWWLGENYWTIGVLSRIGKPLLEDNIDNIKNIIDSCINDEKYANGRKELIRESWNCYGNGAACTVEYLIDKYKALTEK